MAETEGRLKKNFETLMENARISELAEKDLEQAESLASGKDYQSLKSAVLKLEDGMGKLEERLRTLGPEKTHEFVETAILANKIKEDLGEMMLQIAKKKMPAAVGSGK